MRILSLLSISALISLGAALGDYEPFEYKNQFELPGGRSNASIDEPVRTPLKFRNFYSDFKARLEDISTTVCNLSLSAYDGDRAARETLGPVRNYCWTHANCILATLDERTKASFAGTTILLGLAPTTLSVLGPSVAEMALLSIHRPFITLLVSLGAPAVFPGRFLQWEDPLRANEPAVGAFLVRPLRSPWKWIILFLQYGFAAGAVTNVFHAAWRIGTRSIISWACPTNYWPVMWVLMSLLIHFCAILSLRTAITKKTEFGQPRNVEVELPQSVDENGQPIKERSFPGSWILLSEFTLSANSEWQVSDLYNIHLGPFPVMLQYLGAFLSVLYLVFGTLIFSSLLFIGLSEAFQLIMRLIASAAICRILVQFEVGGMIQVDERRVYKGIVQAPLEGSGKEE
ncbi:hypothetical protein TWF106_002919 [Orbilia oligospora]|uniref:Uncharacterized protein n=1 Tax=Orbilia oligospora TaxID=2813651 RepID=A0A6G1MDR9_ORBOL|nr:hypothetical protein TWF679_004338 [Orbilia oligospora]KAF3225038.1 hypothetical protein TWF106_002919 [Orbilia oligospora]KAF3226435.1 hypothetical protein TWF191_004697 [Orbilia oligospora]KAF3252609.1 hypothetical protein TWF192_004411 [Orbilia oligospora]